MSGTVPASPVLCPLQAWLTEIQEFAHHNAVLMLLGNKVGVQAPRGGGHLTRCSQRPVMWQVDSAQERVVQREDGEKLAKVS